jgi:hypothetical protein
MEQLKWNDSSSPDLRDLSKEERFTVRRLIKEYGEIRFRYAACLTESVLQPRCKRWLSAVGTALKENWMSASGMTLLADLRFGHPVQATERFYIPWLRRYFDFEDDGFIKSLSQTSARELLCPRDVLINLCEDQEDQTYDELHGYELMRPTLRLHPDLEFRNVVLWLQYLAEGHRDEQLHRAFDKYRPDLNMMDYASITSAYLRLRGKPMDTLISSEIRD